MGVIITIVQKLRDSLRPEPNPYISVYLGIFITDERGLEWWSGDASLRTNENFSGNDLIEMDEIWEAL